ncbi:MAG: hypothetical protein QGF19_07200, partial [Paracoccaceae bacterium]|nr:hypothetical protein [Paracoccaceae bacterium]
MAKTPKISFLALEAEGDFVDQIVDHTCERLYGDFLFYKVFSNLKYLVTRAPKLIFDIVEMAWQPTGKGRCGPPEQIFLNFFSPRPYLYLNTK